ncbi:hypothetical protein DFH07DRAFT_953328 [Mycena maculata]|uniref:Integrase core domain-containing protein n=1 Tax=Mycena maculata TaxID=230809 RepID=A0AAD7JYK8_9AGAR|nr:hypothetical protein DFH07DRAFT_953328 [Mycena maculata]
MEQMWVEVGTQFARPWRDFFTRLERLHGLNPDNPHHLWLLHYLFLDDINKDCDEFRELWNHHPISGKGHDQTPADMRLIGELKYGKYADNFEEIHPDILERYGDEDDIDVAIAGDQSHHIRHEAVAVAKAECPFQSDDALDIFDRALKEVKAAEIIPENLGVSTVEWDEAGYPEIEIVKAGRNVLANFELGRLQTKATDSEARCETNSGFRSGRKDGKGKETAKAGSSKASGKSSSDDTVSVGSIQVLVGGVNSDGKPRTDKCPNAKDVEEMTGVMLAVYKQA